MNAPAPLQASQAPTQKVVATRRRVLEAVKDVPSPEAPLPQVSQGVLACTLCNLNGYLAAAGHGVDHPWRLEIARGLAEAVLPPGACRTDHVAIDQPYSTTLVDLTNIADQLSMRSAQLRGVLFAMMVDPEADIMAPLAYELAADLAEDVRANFLTSKCPQQLSHLLLLIQNEDGPNDMLWLAQQIADELVELICVHSSHLSSEVTA